MMHIRRTKCYNFSRTMRLSTVDSAIQRPRFLNPVRLSSYSTSDPFASSSMSYLEQLEMDWQRDPNSVSPQWAQFFSTGELPSKIPIMRNTSHTTSATYTGAAHGRGKIVETALYLIDAYQTFGHRLAKLDPLGLSQTPENEIPSELKLETYGLTQDQLNEEFELHGDKGVFLSSKRTTLKKLIEDLKAIYCQNIAWEFMHIPSMEQRDWLRDRIENMKPLDAEEKKLLLQRLMYSDNFEAFCAKKWPNTKRFGLEGCESLIPGIKSLVDRSAHLGVESIVIGMPHRGRLNVLANVVRKPMENIFHEFLASETRPSFGSGDVKYHLGLSIKRTLSGINKRMHLTLLPNPSHLEAVNPLVEGKTRAKQLFSEDTDRKKVVSLLLHGDAAFAAQGVVYETMALSGIEYYTTGGTVHIVVNNQIGFTTNPAQGRSSPYCTDLAKFIGAPVFHVNADDAESVIQVCKLAIDFRQHFGKDIVIDLVGYRRRGHNEIDQPKFTQPMMYQAIDKHPPVLKVYSEKLLKEGSVSEEDYKKLSSFIHNQLDEAYDNAKLGKKKKDTNEWFAEDSEWRHIQGPVEYSPSQSTGLPRETIDRIGRLISTYPNEFQIHPVMARIMKDRLSRIEEGKRFDWGIAENLAYGTLLEEGFVVRISGQDVQRGTFSHRHGVIFDQKSGKGYRQLRSLEKQPGYYMITNSPLSEYGVLGFETGFSWESPNSLVVFEAQFGDFANTAQVIFDQFLASAEQKWSRSSGIVLLLPHGYDGAGPEHSNCHPERILSLCDEDADAFPVDNSRQVQNTNLQVVNCTTPANIFHALRRQLKRSFRKPLIVLSPKHLLRHKHAVSDVEEFLEGTEFNAIYPETNPELLVEDSKVRRVLFCTGQVYYELWEHRSKHEINDVAIIRVEQLSPFPFHLVGEQLQKYSNAEICWVQEEPKNYGCWQHFYFRCKTTQRHVFGDKKDAREIRVITRETSASPATGYKAVHDLEQENLMQQSFA